MTPIFTHWALHVQDIKESVEFYSEFCGLEIVQEHGEGPNDHAVWMTEAGRKGDYVIVLLLGGLGNNQAKVTLRILVLRSQVGMRWINWQRRESRVVA